MFIKLQKRADLGDKSSPNVQNDLLVVKWDVKFFFRPKVWNNSTRFFANLR